jgi:hypothetical protein
MARSRFETTMRRLETLIRTRICGHNVFVDPTNQETCPLIDLNPVGLPTDTFAAIGAAIHRALSVHTVRATTNTPGLPSRLVIVERYGERSALTHVLKPTEQAMEQAKEIGGPEEGQLLELSLPGFAWLLRFYTTAPADRPEDVKVA